MKKKITLLVLLVTTLSLGLVLMSFRQPQADADAETASYEAASFDLPKEAEYITDLKAMPDGTIRALAGSSTAQDVICYTSKDQGKTWDETAKYAYKLPITINQSDYVEGYGYLAEDGMVVSIDHKTVKDRSCYKMHLSRQQLTARIAAINEKAPSELEMERLLHFYSGRQTYLKIIFDGEQWMNSFPDDAILAEHNGTVQVGNATFYYYDSLLDAGNVSQNVELCYAKNLAEFYGKQYKILAGTAAAMLLISAIVGALLYQAMKQNYYPERKSKAMVTGSPFVTKSPDSTDGSWSILCSIIG